MKAGVSNLFFVSFQSDIVIYFLKTKNKKKQQQQQKRKEAKICGMISQSLRIAWTLLRPSRFTSRLCQKYRAVNRRKQTQTE